MPGSSLELKGVRIFAVPEQGPQLRSDRDAVDLISAASEHRAALILIPVQRLGDDFFDLRTHIAGQIAQKFAMYGARVAIVGDLPQRIGESKSLAAFVAESNRGHHLWFVETLEQLRERL
jgi:hypothetical protein